MTVGWIRRWHGDPRGVSSTGATPRHTPAPALTCRRQHPPMPPPPSATNERLRDTIAQCMRMSHIYQPAADAVAEGFRTAVGTARSPQPAPAQDVARRILGEDVTKIDYYTERVKHMVGKVHLQRHHPLREGHLRPGGQ